MIMKSFVSLFKSKSFKIMACICLFLISALIIMAMMLGNEAGMFVIRVQSGNAERSIALTLDPEDKSTYQNKMVTPGIENITDHNPKYFLKKDNEYANLRGYTQTSGDNSQSDEDGYYYSLFIYTFYIVNNGVGNVNVTANMNYSNVTNYNDEVARIMTVKEERSGAISALNVYQKKDEEFTDYSEKGYYEIEPKNFESEKTVFSKQNFVIYQGDYVKYSVFYWIEGEDPDSNKYGSELLNGTIKFDLTFKIDMAI